MMCKNKHHHHKLLLVASTAAIILLATHNAMLMKDAMRAKKRHGLQDKIEHFQHCFERLLDKH